MSTTPPKKDKTKAKAAPAESTNKKRAAKRDYGYHKDAVIRVKEQSEEAKGFRGQRLDWFEKLQKFNGKTCAAFEEKFKGGDSPRGWLRFFVLDAEVATLEAPK